MAASFVRNAMRISDKDHAGLWLDVLDGTRATRGWPRCVRRHSVPKWREVAPGNPTPPMAVTMATKQAMREE